MAASASALESNSTKPVTLPPPHTHAKRVSSPALQQATTSTLGHGTTPLQPRSSAASGTAERTGLSCGRRAAPCRSSLAEHGIAPRAPPDAAPGASDQPIHTRNRSCLSMPWWLAHQPMMGGRVWGRSLAGLLEPSSLAAVKMWALRQPSSQVTPRGTLICTNTRRKLQTRSAHATARQHGFPGHGGAGV